MTEIDTIEVAELRGLVDRLFRGLEEAGIDRIGVTKEHYWTVFPNAAFSADQLASPVLGNVANDLSDLRAEVANLNAGEFVSFWHAFHHLSGLLKLIAFTDMEGGLEAYGKGEV